MKVVAIKPAFYNGSRVRPGVELEVPSDLKGSWFAKTNTPAAEEARAVRSPRARAPKALSELNKADGTSFNDMVEAKSDLA
jgi:hypothetical protein